MTNLTQQIKTNLLFKNKLTRREDTVRYKLDNPGNYKLYRFMFYKLHEKNGVLAYIPIQLVLRYYPLTEWVEFYMNDMLIHHSELKTQKDSDAVIELLKAYGFFYSLRWMHLYCPANSDPCDIIAEPLPSALIDEILDRVVEWDSEEISREVIQMVGLGEAITSPRKRRELARQANPRRGYHLPGEEPEEEVNDDLV